MFKREHRGSTRSSGGAWVLILGMGLLALLSGCGILNYQQDPVGAVMSLPKLADSVMEIKTVSDIKRSFVFRAATILFPDGVPESPEALPTLSGEQQEAVNAFLAQRIQGVQVRASGLIANSPVYQPLQKGAIEFKRVKFLVTGKPEAIVDDTGVVFVDVRIVQAILRSVIIQWQRQGGIEGSSNIFGIYVTPDRHDLYPDARPLSAAEESKAIGQFNRFRTSVASAAPNTEIGIWFKLFTQDTSDGPMSQAFGDGLLNRLFDRALGALNAQMNEAAVLQSARYAQETFESALDFLVAHELAHQAFGHPGARVVPAGAGDADTCHAWQAQESLADELATVLLIQRQFVESRAPSIVKTENGHTIDGDGFTLSVNGGVLFLSTAFQLAGFTQELVKAPCTYPSVAQRLEAQEPLWAYADRARSQGMYLEGLMRGDWLRSRDDARMASILEAARSGEGQRVRALLDPIVEQRFKGKV